ncbi:hypothetical protein B0O80DRAFT_498137 [Mortierella sp. GBAus27b]|nr:hypothetical protein BGX31_010155 [Mortierella sp. GBA43]KAI8354950.1 hypothetical protein B0O80DRAFT_498137 [Mortierella sp. GBAus27b]
MADLIPDLSHYAQGLDPATFPLRIETQGVKGSSLSVQFLIVTLEKYAGAIAMNGQGFHVASFSPFDPSAPPSLSTVSSESGVIPTDAEQNLSPRQKEALGGLLYETIEALLMALSPGFEEFFAQELSRRLNALSPEQLQRTREIESSESDNDG